jgi:serine/threonine protein kinase
MLGRMNSGVVETSNVFVSRDDDDNKVINGYVVLGQLGRGQYGKVKLAEHRDTHKLVAMKIIQLSRFRGAQFQKVREKVSREIAVMKRITHPNLVKLLEVLNAVDKGKMYLILDYIPNGPVAHIDASTGNCMPIPEASLKLYAAQMVAGLMALHRKGIFHRDVKPDNMLLGENNRLYIADFGVSVICSEEGVEGVEGTPAYMSPELCRGEKCVSGDAVDAWALGVTLYQLLFGRLPFVGETPLQLTRRIVNEEPSFASVTRTSNSDDDEEEDEDERDVFSRKGPPKEEINPSPEVVTVIRGLLRKDQESRMTLRQVARSDWLRDVDMPSAPVSARPKGSELCSPGTDSLVEHSASATVSLDGSSSVILPQRPHSIASLEMSSAMTEAELTAAIGDVVEEAHPHPPMDAESGGGGGGHQLLPHASHRSVRGDDRHELSPPERLKPVLWNNLRGKILAARNHQIVKVSPR